MRIVVASGKGGTGKTTVAVNLAVSAARAGHEVHLGDCDVEEPNANIFLNTELPTSRTVTVPVPRVDQDICTHCGACADICEFNAIACLPRQTMVFEDLCHSCAGCWLVCPEQAITQRDRVLGEVATGMVEGMNFTEGRLRIGETVVPPLIQEVKSETAGHPWVILDAPPGTTCPVVETMRDADFVVLVTEPTPFGQHDLELAVELARVLELPCGVVINRAQAGRDQIDRYCEREGLRVLARIPFQRAVAEACAEGALAIDVDDEVASSVEGLFQALKGLEVKS